MAESDRFAFLTRERMRLLLDEPSGAALETYFDCLCALHDLVEHARLFVSDEFRPRFADVGVANAMLDDCIRAAGDQPEWMREYVKMNVAVAGRLVTRERLAVSVEAPWSDVVEREISLAGFANDALRQYTLLRFLANGETARA